MTSSDAGATSSSISSPTAPSPMPTLSPAPSLTPSPVSTTSDNSNHRPFAGGMLRSTHDVDAPGGPMGQSKIPIYAYVDESGNTGRNIFDPSQPDYYTAALLNKGNFDSCYSDRIGIIAGKIGATSIHANELGLSRLETIAPDLFELLSGATLIFSCRAW